MSGIKSIFIGHVLTQVALLWLLPALGAGWWRREVADCSNSPWGYWEFAHCLHLCSLPAVQVCLPIRNVAKNADSQRAYQTKACLVSSVNIWILCISFDLLTWKNVTVVRSFYCLSKWQGIFTIFLLWTKFWSYTLTKWKYF